MLILKNLLSSYTLIFCSIKITCDIINISKKNEFIKYNKSHIDYFWYQRFRFSPLNSATSIPLLNLLLQTIKYQFKK